MTDKIKSRIDTILAGYEEKPLPADVAREVDKILSAAKNKLPN